MCEEIGRMLGKMLKEPEKWCQMFKKWLSALRSPSSGICPPCSVFRPLSSVFCPLSSGSYRELTDAATKFYEVPKESIVVVVKENPPDNVGVGGLLISDRKKD